MAASRLRRVLFDFEAVDQAELSVRKGELVTARPPEEQEPSSGWLLVEATNPPRSGFVPEGFVAPVEEEPRPPSVQQQQQQQRAAPPSEGPEAAAAPPAAPSAGGPQGADDRTSDGSQQGAQQPPAPEPAPAPAAAPGSGWAPPSSGMPSRAASEDAPQPPQRAAYAAPQPAPQTAPAPAVDEAYFRAVSKRRRDAYSKLDQCVSEASAEVAECKERTQQLARRLGGLGALLDEERSRLVARISAERSALQQHEAALAQAGLPPSARGSWG
eukprot:TRINITY_DN7308_c0_g1_i1.p1 TRINITY_DN7308_c0_g1~~TRINITY_DN7308_c0_g1_i1.p1  ORF type:complete len:296 (+),score=91.20 TRINITY_DN7308_c0_g1_i1:78-890(+)